MGSASLPTKQVGAAASFCSCRCLCPCSCANACSRLKLPACHLPRSPRLAAASACLPACLPAVFVPVSQGPLQSEWSFVRQAVKYSVWMEAQASTQSNNLAASLAASPAQLLPAAASCCPHTLHHRGNHYCCHHTLPAVYEQPALPAPAACPACRRVVCLRATPMRSLPLPGPCALSAWCLSTAGGRAASISTSMCR